MPEPKYQQVEGIRLQGVNCWELFTCTSPASCLPPCSTLAMLGPNQPRHTGSCLLTRWPPHGLLRPSSGSQLGKAEVANLPSAQGFSSPTWGSLGEGSNEDECIPPCPRGWLYDLGASCPDCSLIAHWTEGYLKFDRMKALGRKG